MWHHALFPEVFGLLHWEDALVACVWRRHAAPLAQGLAQARLVASFDPRQNLKAPKFLHGHHPTCDVAQILQDLIIRKVADARCRVRSVWEVLGSLLRALVLLGSGCIHPIGAVQTIACQRASFMAQVKRPP